MPGSPTLLHDLVDAGAATAPADPALADERVSWSFEELRKRTTGIAAVVAARCSPGGSVAVLAHSRAEYVAAYYGVPRAGRVLVLLNPRLHPREWVEQLRRARVELVVGEPDLLDALRTAGAPPAVPTLTFDDLPPASGDDASSLPQPSPDTTAWLLFTSGTTGPPKGVRLTHRSLLAAVRNTAAGRPVAPDDVFCTPFPLCHVAGYSVLVHHLHRRPVRLMRRFDAADLARAIVDHGVSSVSLAPTMLDALLAHLESQPELLGQVRQRLHRIGYGASPIPEPLLRRTLGVLGCDLNQGYGMTELSDNAVFLDAAAHRAAVDGRPHLLAAAGRAGPLVDVRILGHDGEPVPTGEVGEIAVRGDQVTPGYWDDDSATAAAFTDGWFRTGDVGRLDDNGVLYVVDRLKDVVITGGENVSSREVEDVIRRVAGVADVAVVGVPDERWGERVCAAVVRTADGATTGSPGEADVVAACRERLAGFKVPRTVVFVDDLPRTATGKVRKDVLRSSLT